MTPFTDVMNSFARRLVRNGKILSLCLMHRGLSMVIFTLELMLVSQFKAVKYERENVTQDTEHIRYCIRNS